jgi:RecA/RadA recombinase
MICKRTKYVDKVFHGKTGSHVVSQWVGGKWLCTCISYQVRKLCKHRKGLLKYMSAIEIDDIINNKDLSKEFPSSLEVVNELFGERAYNSNVITSIYGKAGTGKSLFAIQDAVYLSSLGKNVLFIDTEGSIIPMMKKWVPVFEKRFGKRKGKIFIESKKSLVGLLSYLGHVVVLDYIFSNKPKPGKVSKAKKKGKLEFRVLEQKENELDTFVEENKIDFIVLDSLTSVLREFTKEQQNLPSRSDAIAFIMREFVAIQEKYSIGVVITNHAVFNAANPYEVHADCTGGIVVKHYSKRMIYIDKRDKVETRNYRRFWLVRNENSSAWSKAGVALINDNGYNCIDEMEERELNFTSTELERLT